MTNNYRAALDAFAMIDRMTKCDCDSTDNRICLHFLADAALRDLLIERDATPSTDDRFASLEPDAAIYDMLRYLLSIIDDTDYMTDRMTALLLDHSLCPMHRIDYAICFDDDDPDCAAIRAIHPSHDT